MTLKLVKGPKKNRSSVSEVKPLLQIAFSRMAWIQYKDNVQRIVATSALISSVMNAPDRIEGREE